jgi:hypothetical protein
MEGREERKSKEDKENGNKTKQNKTKHRAKEINRER